VVLHGNARGGLRAQLQVYGQTATGCPRAAAVDGRVPARPHV